jgi:hypothetical protein
LAHGLYLHLANLQVLSNPRRVNSRHLLRGHKVATISGGWVNERTLTIMNQMA